MQTATVPGMIRFAERERAISELDDISQLVRVHRARLLRFVTYSLGDQDLAESIVQDCFVKAYAARGTFRGDCSVQTWLNGIALNMIRDHLRTQKFRFWRKVRQTAVEIAEIASTAPSGESSPETQLLAREKAREVAVALEALSFNQRTIFLMRFQEEMGVSEIAAAMKMPANTVKTHLHRAVRAIRERVGGVR